MVGDSEIVLGQIERDEAFAGPHTSDNVVHAFHCEGIVCQVQVRDETHWVTEHCAELLSASNSDFDPVLVAVVVGQVEGDESLVPSQTL